MLQVLDLFSGIGGFSYGLERLCGGFRTAMFCERDPFCRQVLATHWPEVPCHDDIHTLDPSAAGPVDLVCGGFPCQPFSVAGKRRGADDDRYLWPEMLRVVAAVRPAWVLGENVAGIIGLALDGVLADLEGLGYTVWPAVVPACAVDAPHRRDRVWIVAHDAQRRRGVQPGCDPATPGPARPPGGCGRGQPVADAVGDRQPQPQGRLEVLGRRPGDSGAAADPDASSPRLAASQREHLCREGRRHEGGAVAEPCRWRAEPGVGRVADGVPGRVDRLRSLGNAAVPQVVAEFGRAIIAAEAAGRPVIKQEG